LSREEPVIDTEFRLMNMYLKSSHILIICFSFACTTEFRTSVSDESVEEQDDPESEIFDEHVEATDPDTHDMVEGEPSSDIGEDTADTSDVDLIEGSECGDGLCNVGEDYFSCPEDCTAGMFQIWGKPADRVVGIAVGDVDNDGHEEVAAALYALGSVRIYSIDLAVVEAEVSFAEPPCSLAIGDVDADAGGLNELLIATSNSDDGGYLHIGRVSGGSWLPAASSSIISSFRYGDELSVGDANDNGIPEIAVGVSWYGRYLSVMEYDGMTYDRIFHEVIGSDVNSVHYADVDGDGVDELLVGTACWEDFSYRVYDGYTLAHRVSGGSCAVAAADVSGDGTPDVIAVSGAYCGSRLPQARVDAVDCSGGTCTEIWSTELDHNVEPIWIAAGLFCGQVYIATGGKVDSGNGWINILDRDGIVQEQINLEPDETTNHIEWNANGFYAATYRRILRLMPVCD